MFMFFFFFKQKTAYEMRISDWSSDVCSSDLGGQQFKGKGEASQSNALSGEVSVTVAAVYPNGTMLVKGEKFLTLNRGDERVQIRSEERRVGKECVSTCRYRGSPDH